MPIGTFCQIWEGLAFLNLSRYRDDELVALPQRNDAPWPLFREAVQCTAGRTYTPHGESNFILGLV